MRKVQTFTVGCVQLACGTGPGGLPAADLVVLPELWEVGYFAFDDYATAARPLEEAVLSMRLRGSTIVAGSVLERDGDRLYNTIAVVSPGGELLGGYRKRHLFAYGSREAELLTPGDETVVVDTPVGRLGLATCFDLRFPQQFADMRAMGADLFVVPAAWPSPRIEHWRVLAQARAIENQTPLAGCNGAGECFGTELGGHSLVVDATGGILAEAGADPGWIVAGIDHDATDAWRREFPLSAL